MSRLDELPPDQRAALSLLLRQRKSYAEVAAMLGIGERAVHDRAHGALAVLAPLQARGLAPQERALIGDYLLGQQGVADRVRARALLTGSEPARVWGQALAQELAPLPGAVLPEIPAAESTTNAPPAPAHPAAPARQAAPGAGGAAPAPARGEYPAPSSRLGGALLLAAILAAVVVAIVLLTNNHSGSPRRTASTGAAAATTGPAPTAAGSPRINARLPLRPPGGGSAVGLLEVLSEGTKRAFYLVAEHVAPTRGFFYALWLYNSPTSEEPLGKAPAVGTNQHLEGGALLPANAGNFREVLLTRETSTHATHPGPIVLRGRFSLAG